MEDEDIIRAVADGGQNYETRTIRGREVIRVPSGGTLENILFDCRGNSDLNIVARGTNWTVRNIGVLGEHNGQGPIFGVADEGGGTSTIEHVYMGDGTSAPRQRRYPSHGIWVAPSHSGHLNINGVYIYDANDNAFYCSAPGSNSNGALGTVHIRNCYARDNWISCFRLARGTVENCVGVNTSSGRNGRPLWVWPTNRHGDTVQIRNCHFIAGPYNWAAILGAASASRQVNVHFENVEVSGNVQRNSNNLNFTGGYGNNAQHFVPEGCPESAQEAASGGVWSPPDDDWDPEPEFSVDADAPDSVEVGGSASLDITITNTGDGEGTTEYEVNITGVDTDTDEIQLDGGEAYEASYPIPTTQERVINWHVATDDDEESGEVTVYEDEDDPPDDDPDDPEHHYVWHHPEDGPSNVDPPEIDEETIELEEGEHYTEEVRDGETFRDVRFDLSAPDTAVTITARGDDWSIRNVALDGVTDGGDSPCNALNLAVEADGEGLVENVYLGDGSDGGCGPRGRSAIYISERHEGIVNIRDCHIANWEADGIYGNRPGGVEEEYGDGGTVRIENCWISENEDRNIALSTVGSDIRHTRIVGGSVGVELSNIRHHEELLITDSDFSFPEEGVAIRTIGDDVGATVQHCRFDGKIITTTEDDDGTPTGAGYGEGGYGEGPYGGGTTGPDHAVLFDQPSAGAETDVQTGVAETSDDVFDRGSWWRPPDTREIFVHDVYISGALEYGLRVGSADPDVDVVVDNCTIDVEGIGVIAEHNPVLLRDCDINGEEEHLATASGGEFYLEDVRFGEDANLAPPASSPRAASEAAGAQIDATRPGNFTGQS